MLTPRKWSSPPAPIGSAQLLMSSGIGPQSHLAEVGIDVQLDLPGVGANLQDHAWAMVAYRAGGTQSRLDATTMGRCLAWSTARTSLGAPDLQLIFLRYRREASWSASTASATATPSGYA